MNEQYLQQDIERYRKMTSTEWQREDSVRFVISAIVISMLIYFAGQDSWTDDMGFYHHPPDRFFLGIVWTIAMYISYRVIDSRRQSGARYAEEHLKYLYKKLNEVRSNSVSEPNKQLQPIAPKDGAPVER